jgi:hypothetical protein
VITLPERSLVVLRAVWKAPVPAEDTFAADLAAQLLPSHAMQRELGTSR